MQDIVFYVAANETLGLVRDYANMHRTDAPVLTIGVAACLRMRLFADIEVSTPYPVTSFSSITDWRWSMDADFNRSTACKLVADEGGISVHTVTDTVNDETRSFTEIVIPISNMNTQELAAWLGNDGTKTGLTGELVGYDNNGNAVFVLQVENFTVRNRVAGLCDPTAVDEGIVTRSVAEQMIRTAVSSSAATKQDKLTSSNGGTGISVTGTGIISVSDVPQSAVTGLSASLAGKQDKLTSSNGGTGISVTSTGIISVSDVPQSAVTGLSASLAGKQNALTIGWGLDLDHYDDILSIARYRTINVPTGATVTIVPGEAYKINATVSAKTINAASLPDNTWGLEGHLEIFVAGTGYVQTGENVVLANALEPDAVNNCTVRFHDGLAIISVEDHVAGYIVTVNAVSGYGSLNNALSVDSREYIAVDASLNGQTLDFGGAVTNVEKHVVGNGYTETIVSGDINCTSKTTLSNLGMDGVVVSSGTLTLGDVYIPDGATVAVSGGGLAIEKVTDNGTLEANGNTFVQNGSLFVGSGVVDGGGSAGIKPAVNYTEQTVYASGITFTNCSPVFNGGLGPQVDFTNCVFSGNSGTTVVNLYKYNGALHSYLKNCTFEGNNATVASVYPTAGYIVNIEGCTFGSGENIDASISDGTRPSQLNMMGTNKTLGKIIGTSATITIASGAIVDLTGNTNATPINPGGGVTFAPGGATVYPSAGQASAYMLGGMTVPQIGNTNVVPLGGTNLLSPGRIDNVTISGGSAGTATSGYGGAIYIAENKVTSISNVSFTGNYASGGLQNLGNAVFVRSGAKLIASNCLFDAGESVCVYNYTASSYTGLEIGGTFKTLSLVNKGPSGTGANVYVSAGAIVDLTGNTNATPINPGGDVIVDGGCTVITSAGETVSITGGTYSKINNDGTTE